MNYRALIFIVILASCTAEPEVVEYYDNGQAKKVLSVEKDLDKEVINYKNGQPFIIKYFKDGLKEGHWKSWYEHGTLWTETYYSEGKKNGDYIVYYMNGKPKITGQYIKEEKAGEWKFYTEQGDVERTINYDSDSN